jgi:hypothetical protein
MNIFQATRAHPLNRHHYVDLLVGIVVFQFVKVALIMFCGNLESVPNDDSARPFIWFVLMAVLFAPLFENLSMIALAALHQKLWGPTGLFIVTPLLMAALHFTNPQHLPFPLALRVLELFVFFYIYLKQYDLHKRELGKYKAFLLSSSLHFATNASGLLALYLTDMYIDAETIFSAQPGE